MVYALLVVAGLFAGYVNAIAGAGSLLTLPALIFSGLDPSAANATNRISVITQSLSSGLAYRHGGIRLPPGVLWLCAAASAGAAAGALIATLLEPGAIRLAIAVVMIVMLVLSFVRPPSDGAVERLRVRPVTLIGFAVIGVYGGFIQAGAGIIILLFIGTLRGDLVTGNAVKVLVILILTVIAIGVFAFRGETIDLARGLVLAASTAVGGVIGARAAIRRGAGFIRLIVVVAVIGSAGRLLWEMF